MLRITIVLNRSHKSPQAHESLCRKSSDIHIPHRGLNQRDKRCCDQLGFSSWNRWVLVQGDLGSECVVAKGASCDLATSPLGHHPAAPHPGPLLGFESLPIPKKSEI